VEVSGKIEGFTSPTETITNIILKKSAKGKPYNINLICFGDVSAKVKSELLIDDYVKFTFVIRSKEYKGRYYTDLIVVRYEIKRRKEKKIKKITQIGLIDLETGEILSPENNPPF
tara:strand:+ start:174 stop:518 length:345 start_codon:yes stop_codon:yes gene_type:complete